MAHDQAAYEARVQFAWQDALEWAKRGDRRSLVALLRGEQQLSEREVLDFLADLVEGKFKWPRGKPAQRPESTFAMDTNGKIVWVDKRDATVLEMRKWVSENRRSLGNGVYEAAAKHFGMDSESEKVIESIATLCRRSINSRVRSRSSA
ncbi:hypothetical protein [Nitrobacter sp.]|uniref:hypothetical protein n=1 Tax=Nitrobacter sp. TaxID=29420 RepID=UPI003F651027